MSDYTDNSNDRPYKKYNLTSPDNIVKSSSHDYEYWDKIYNFKSSSLSPKM